MTERDTSLDHRSLDWAVEIIGMCEPIRCTQGGMWFGHNHNFADATFVDYGAADAFAVAAKALPALVKALQLQEQAEHAHMNCDECEGEDVPEFCPKCFPLYDAARLARWHALRSGQPQNGHPSSQKDPS